uniref:Uncharacterized protein n=1 Tax=Anopheles melas TaxID=34690 RepID=A0A182TG12_9DIPT
MKLGKGSEYLILRESSESFGVVWSRPESESFGVVRNRSESFGVVRSRPESESSGVVRSRSTPDDSGRFRTTPDDSGRLQTTPNDSDSGRNYLREKDGSIEACTGSTDGKGN